MAGRKKKGYELEEKLNTYQEAYELDDLNRANDLASLRQLCHFEIIIEKLQAKVTTLKDFDKNSKAMKDLTTALRDTVNSYTSLQTALGINRAKRQSDSDESVLSYIDKLKDQAKKVWDVRLKKVICNDCHLPLGKFYIYITEKGEPGAIAYDGKTIEPIKYSFEIECPQCFKMVAVTNESV